MTNPYGPWATAIDTGGSAKLSSFWRQRLTMLVSVSKASPVLSRFNRLGLIAAAALVCALPTFHAAPAVAEQEKAIQGKSDDTRPDSGENWIPESNDIFLKKLRAKDEQFNNLSLTCDFVDLNVRLAVEDLVKEFEEAEKTGKTLPPRKLATRRQLTVQNSQTTLDIHPNDEKSSRLYNSTKSSNATDVDQNMLVIGDDRIFHTTSKPSDPNGLLAEHRMLMELSLGVGYGKRIMSITKVTADGKFAVVEATMRLWSNDVTQAHLKLDDLFVVREATLLANSDGHKSRFEISTKGLTEAQKGRQIAASGQLKRTALTGMVNGKEIMMPKDDIRDHFEIRVVKLQYDLEDAAYRQLIDLRPASATHVVGDSKP